MKSSYKIIGAVENAIIGVFALLSCILVVSEAFIRFVAPENLPDWGREVTIYLIGWAVMLCAGQMVREKMHVGVDIVLQTLSSRSLRYLEIFTALFGLIVSGFIVYAGAKSVEFAWRFGEQSDSSIRFPMWLFYLSIPFGFGLTGLQYAIQLVAAFRGSAEMMLLFIVAAFIVLLLAGVPIFLSLSGLSLRVAD